LGLTVVVVLSLDSDLQALNGYVMKNNTMDIMI
jgi:hypothetical protein